jgi:hypothetical protein
LAVEHEDLQKKTFTKWINAQFAASNRPLVNDLFEDLRDGTKILSLLAILTGRDLVSVFLKILYNVTDEETILLILRGS